MHTLAAAAAAAIIILTMYFVMCAVTSEAWMQNGLYRAEQNMKEIWVSKRERAINPRLGQH